MKKNFLQDVVPASHKRSIRDIPLPKHREGKKTVSDAPLRARPVAEPEVAPEPEDKEPVFNPRKFNETAYQTPDDSEQDLEPVSKTPFRSDGPRRRSGRGKKAFTTFILIGALVGAVFLFGRTKAEIVVYPKKSTYEIDVQVPVGASSTLATVTQVTKTQSVSLEATSEQQVEQQAKGRIRIINNHKEEPQELVKNTRFQTPEGLVYRIKESVSVPGFKVVNGQQVPGSLEVEVYADSAGEEYNIGKTKFTIPGFSGMEQFDKITAESVTDMTGGYIGVKKVVSDDEEDDAYDELKAKLEAEFTAKAIESGDTIVVPDIETVTYGELTDSVDGDTVTLSLTANATAYSFNKQDLYNYIGQRTITGTTAADQFMLQTQPLDFLADSNAVIVTGSSELTWLTDLEALKAEIAGKKRSEVVQIMGTHQSIEKADIALDPFWKTKFPSDTSKIKAEMAE